MNPVELLSVLPFLIVAVTIITALRTGRILNARGASPMILSRAEHNDGYWTQVLLRVLGAVFTGWIAFEVLFATP
jgi:hypothetical protein